MEFLARFLICVLLIDLTYSRSLPEENILQLQNTTCSCDLRYFKHYEAKGCLVELTDSCGCPQKYSCLSNQTQLTAAAKVCTYQNKEYKVGSKIISSDSCQVCRCREGVPPYISCVTRECPEFDDIPGQNCHLIYNESKCCPVGIECFKNETDVTSNKTCEYNGKFYPFGSKIYPIDDPCQTCVCDERWKEGDNSSCYQEDCMFERNKARLDEGCIPVYHESRCCPIEFYCPSSHNLSYSVLSSNESANDYNMLDNRCTFAGQNYELGEELLIDNPCVKCTCIVPPDLTCVHQTCPRSPSEKNCYANYNSGECCPVFECMLGDTELHPVGCPTPLCADSSCRIETPPGHECPTCVCPERNSELEHNNLEQIQQMSQDIEQQFEHVQQAFEPTDDISDDELQMMPLRIEDTEGDISVLEKLILPEAEDMELYSEGLRELEEGSFEDNITTEAVSTASVENSVAEEDSSTFLPELNLDDSYDDSVSNQSERLFQKRSDVSDAANSEQTEAMPVQQEMKGDSEDIEREDGVLVKNSNFEDEFENFRNKIFNKNRTIINEIININHVVKVPPGCPTPMCEGPWCKIGIPPGEKCPTCICKRHEP